MNHVLKAAITISFLVAGCATGPFARTPRISDIEGKWYWSQNPWHGDFVLEKKEGSYTGTMDDVYEGTYGDLIIDVKVSGSHIEFTRDGRYGIQHWAGTLKVEEGRLKIVDGRWTKQSGPSGVFYAEKSN